LPAVANLETELGRLEAASERCRTALDIARQLGLLRVEAHACAQAAVIEHALGRSERAMALARQSLDAAGATADRHLRAFALAHLGALEAGCGRIDEATRAFRSAREALDAELIGAIVDVLEGFADLAAARQARRAGDHAEHGRLVSQASQRVTLAAAEGGAERAPSGSSPASRWSDVRVAVQLLERALAAHAQSTASPPAREGSSPPANVAAEADEMRSDALVVGADGRWLRLSGGKVVDLSRYQAVRRILVVLARTRIASPGVALPVEALVEAGWPGEAMRAGSGAERVYTSIRVLRKLGLTDVLIRRDDGYLIDPRLPVVCSAS
jgi:tetratricopeptide (TPR) repeat protein